MPRSSRARSVVALAAVLAAALPGGVNALSARPVGGAAAAPHRPARTEPLNGSFERGVSGWTVDGATLRRAASAAVGRRSARVSALAASRPFALRLGRGPVIKPGSGLTLGAWIKGAGASHVCLELSERPTPSTGAPRACVDVGSRWRRAVVRYRGIGAGNRLSVVLTSMVGSAGDGFLVDGVTLTKKDPRAGRSARSRLAWRADHESGDLRQWEAGGGEYNSGDADTEVTTAKAHTGKRAAAMTITAPPESGTRLFRMRESRSGADAYYGVWYFIPRSYEVEEYWNLFQFKSETSTENDPWWVLDVGTRSGTGRLYLFLRYKGTLPGPRERDVGREETKYFWQSASDIPIGRWFHVEVFLSQSSGFRGRIIVWQDGMRLFDLAKVKTKFVGGDQRWSVNNYSNDLSPRPSVIYVDDATVRLGRP